MIITEKMIIIQSIRQMNESKLRKGTKYVALKDEDIHTVTGALKQFFRELKTDLIPIEIVKRLPDDFGEYIFYSPLALDKNYAINNSSTLICVYLFLENADNLSKIRIEMDKIESLPRECLKYLLKHLIL